MNHQVTLLMPSTGQVLEMVQKHNKRSMEDGSEKKMMEKGLKRIYYSRKES